MLSGTGHRVPLPCAFVHRIRYITLVFLVNLKHLFSPLEVQTLAFLKTELVIDSFNSNIASFPITNSLGS